MKGHKLVTGFNAHDENALYWTDGKAVFFRGYEIKGADIESFEQFPGGWAKDKKHCYSGNMKLKNADTLTFEVLNFTYVKDKSNVWTVGGRIPEADIGTFEICDSGKKSLGLSVVKVENGQKAYHENFAPYGFAKDMDNVYYYDFQGKTKIVKKAIPSSFHSLGDGYFGYDEKFVFCGQSVIPKAKPATWRKLHEEYFYSRDENRIYYFNRLIKEADAETFEIVVVPSIYGNPSQYAKDKNVGYLNDNTVSLEELEKRVRDDLVKNEKEKL